MLTEMQGLLPAQVGNYNHYFDCSSFFGFPCCSFFTLMVLHISLASGVTLTIDSLFKQFSYHKTFSSSFC